MMAQLAIRTAGHEISDLPRDVPGDGSYTMMPLWRPGTPHGGALSGHDEYAMWDAAYVLGALSSAERREFESHMGTCKPCRDAVAEISGMPALLSRLDGDEVAQIDELGQAASAPPPLRPELLTSLLKKVTWRRRRSRVLTWAVAAAAAAVLVVGVFVAWRSNPAMPSPEQPRASASA